MAGPRILPKGTSLWPENRTGLAVEDVVKMYSGGFAGAYSEPVERERFEELIVARGGSPDGEMIATRSGFAETGAGQLIIPFVHALELFPGCLPGPGQDRGDCVSHDQKNANMVSYACEIVAGQPDEVTGKVEGVPEIPAAGLREGAFSTEVYYWFRRHGGDGWSCDAAAQVAMKEAGLVTRDDHPEIGVDLTKYSGRNAGQYGRRPPTGSVADAVNNNLIRQATNVREREARRDFLANGYAMSTCGGEGWARKRDENGMTRRSGSWAHAMAFLGFDDRESTKAIYGDSLELVQNSWAVWNGGPRDIRDSARYVPAAKRELWGSLGIVNEQTGNIMIPEGSFWALSRDVSRRRVIAKSSVNGWPRRAISLGNDAI